MKKNEMLQVVFTFMVLVVFGGISNAGACDFSEGPDEHASSHKILLTAAIHDDTVESMTCEGMPYNDRQDRIIIASSRVKYQSDDSMHSEGISFEEINAVHIANIRDRALKVKPAAGSDL
ncbi:MAG: hypothetical protein H8E41_03895 [Desulfobulbaceae bacterium]|uniref:Uncharacterized protein n=1 Tax=Candidatus Desulfobia pelagia TaxID=2841692 RepID=A0A8J6NDZ1_9BACT|nr:hypothetical protein [Candidatus Desulfobia pelagia]